MEQYVREVTVNFRDGSQAAVNLRADDKSDGDRDLYTVQIEHGDLTAIGGSEIGFFDALRIVRGKLEEAGILLNCFGASEDVYPSPMQESMGPAVLAYRNYLGQQARLSDIV